MQFQKYVITVCKCSIILYLYTANLLKETSKFMQTVISMQFAYFANGKSAMVIAQ